MPAPPLLLLAMLSTVAVLVGREAVGEGEGEEVAVGVARILRLLVGEAVPLRPAERLPEAVLPARLAVAQAEGLGLPEGEPLALALLQALTEAEALVEGQGDGEPDGLPLVVPDAQ